MVVEIYKETWDSLSTVRSQVTSLEEFRQRVNIGEDSLATVFVPETKANTEELVREVLREARALFDVDVRFIASDEKAILVWTRFDKGIKVWWRLVNFVAESLLEAEQG